MSDSRPRLLVLSHVVPFPPTSGQRMRVYYTLLAARERFHVTFVAPVADAERSEVARGLASLCDETILLPRKFARNRIMAAWHRAAGTIYALATGLKRSNHAIGRVELSPARIADVIRESGLGFDCALFEYWHATPAVSVLRQRGIPCLLDMHDILWRSYERQVGARRGLPSSVKRWAVRRYRSREERAWRAYDGVTTINEEEHHYVARQGLPASTRVFCAPMGVDLERWPYQWRPASPRRVAFYGGFRGAQNQAGARRCIEGILPAIWKRRPDTELWLVGSEPPPWLRKAAARDPRIRVTGFVEDVAPVLGTMSAVLCPWSGTYGFRSRIVEVMAVGAPVVASRDALDGMGIAEGQGVIFGESDTDLAEGALRVMDEPALAESLSRAGRERIAALYGLDQTYGRWMREVEDWLPARDRMAS